MRVFRNRYGGSCGFRIISGDAARRPVDDRFFASLSACGNVEASARLVGFSNEAIWYRWRKYPGFARRMEEALCEAEVRLEFRLACHGQSVGRWLDEAVGRGEASDSRHSRESGNPDAADDMDAGLDPRVRGDDGAGAEVPFDPDFALRFLKWREEKRRGAVNRGAAVAAPPPIDEVTERIIAKVEAIERHERRRQGARHRRGGDGGDRAGKGTVTFRARVLDLMPRRVKATVHKAAVERLRRATPRVRRLALRALPGADRRAFDSHWPGWAHEGQLPDRDDWRQWIVMAGRGFGKTRAGAEWVSAMARAHPGAAIALVGATIEEARAVMVENGRSGLLAMARAEERGAMVWQPSRRRLVFASGAEAFLYSAANPESLRGPEHHFAWCDELAKWKRGEAAWDNLRLGLRLGARPRAVVTTTPRPVPLLRRLLADPHTTRSGGPSWGNPHSGDDYIAAVREAHEGTRFGRQELEGVLIEDVKGRALATGADREIAGG